MDASRRAHLSRYFPIPHWVDSPSDRMHGMSDPACVRFNGGRCRWSKSCRGCCCLRLPALSCRPPPAARDRCIAASARRAASVIRIRPAPPAADWIGRWTILHRPNPNRPLQRCRLARLILLLHRDADGAIPAEDHCACTAPRVHAPQAASAMPRRSDAGWHLIASACIEPSNSSAIWMSRSGRFVVDSEEIPRNGSLPAITSSSLPGTRASRWRAGTCPACRACRQHGRDGSD